MPMKIFDYTPWELLETYQHAGTWYCVQVRMNKITGLKKFKVTRITGSFECCHKNISIEAINEKTKL